MIEHYIPHRAHQRAKVLSLGSLAKSTDSQLRGDPDLLISGVGSIQHAQSAQITFLANPKFVSYLKNSAASAVVLTFLCFLQAFQNIKVCMSIVISFN